MSKWVTLSRQQHSDLFYLPRQNYRFTATYAVVPILAGELRQAVTQFVMGFIKRGERFTLVALLGQGESSHHYIHPEDGRWLGVYIPAVFRGYPFGLAKQETTGEMVLQVHADHLSHEAGEPLFDDSGELNNAVAQQLSFLGECEKNRQQTGEACQRLAESGVLQPWQTGKDGPNAIGLYQINEEMLNKLSEADFYQLQGVPLALAYGQLFSMAQHEQLSQRSELHAKLSVPESIDELFADNDDDLRFDF
ncbi:SapC-like S-layer protein [Halomonas citrativorans]|uniref:SapC-like S-layer protein n=1 Tax=Halomonas citrativorans TaxID=2742612 RepID=A0A1R4HXG1_9GAMM|nr:SapC family protein [Halomonas citrativorans]SJN12178.1 SapC-like S-layer protein [Halomonas citrativorans]